ncbi:hypothetical protein DYB26_012145, partial [Aphanomyces astaci]
MIGKAISLHYVQQVAIRRAVVDIVVRLKDPNAAVPCAVKPLPRSPLHAGIIHQLLTSGFNHMATPTPTPVAAPFDSPAPAATPTGATNLPPVPDDDDMGQGDERGFVYNARSLTRPHLEVLKTRLTTAILFDTTILDADSRIGKMLDNLMRALEHDDQAWVLDQEGKTVVDIMVKAIKPLGLQKSVQRQLALQRNKPLKSNVYRFVDWLRVHTAGYHLYAPVEDEKTSAPPVTAAAAPSRSSKPGRSEGSV